MHALGSSGTRIAAQVKRSPSVDGNRDVALEACLRRDDQGVDPALLAGQGAGRESPRGAMGQLDVVNAEAGDRLAEGEGVGDVAVGRAFAVVADGHRRRAEVVGLRQRLLAHAAVACHVLRRVDSHAQGQRAFLTQTRVDHQGIDGGADAREGALAAASDRHVVGGEAGHRLAEGECVEDAAAGDVGHWGRLVAGNGQRGRRGV